MQTYTNNIVLTWVALTGTVLGGSPRVGEGSERRWGVKLKVKLFRAVWEQQQVGGSTHPSSAHLALAIAVPLRASLPSLVRSFDITVLPLCPPPSSLLRPALQSPCLLSCPHPHSSPPRPGPLLLPIAPLTLEISFACLSFCLLTIPQACSIAPGRAGA